MSWEYCWTDRVGRCRASARAVTWGCSRAEKLRPEPVADAHQQGRLPTLALIRRQQRSPGDHCAGATATVGAGATAFNWSNSVSTACQRTWSFFVSIAAVGSE